MLLCEDTQHETFARRFIMKMGWTIRQLRPIKAPGGRGAAEQFVRRHFPMELKRLRAGHVNVSMLVLIDGDRFGLKERLAQLDAACDQERIPRKRENESVFVFVPTWNIETWLAYLEGKTVSEGNRGYPRLTHESNCQSHVGELVEMCRAGQLRLPAPSSLIAACGDYQRFLLQNPRQ